MGQEVITALKGVRMGQEVITALKGIRMEQHKSWYCPQLLS